ncbi:MAG TPA: hypothetical protein VFL73_02005 [Solirubrobacteraceae bacterium]|nr:hypothetical protein [Solirubrobacteraceae bacterium]
MRRFVRVFVLLAVALVLPASAFAEPEREHGNGVELRGGVVAPPDHLALPNGQLTVSPALGPAGLTGQVTLTVHLAEDANGASLRATLPQRFVERAANGLRYAGTPRLRATGRGNAKSWVAGRDLTVDLGAAPAGSDVSFTIDVSGLPAGTWPIKLRWRDAQNRVTNAGTAAFALVPARREPAAEGRDAGPFGALAAVRIEQDVSNDGTEESETFVAVDPADPARLVSAANDISQDGTGGVFLSNDSGRSFTALHFPTLFRLTSSVTEPEIPSGDPIAAADDLGNIWVGGLSLCDTPTSRSHIFVNRIAAGANSFRSANAAIPFYPNDGGGDCGSATEAVQDKPQMTIDNWKSSPTYGRLYVTWDDLDLQGADKGQIHEVVSFCDTRPDPANCDSGSGWSTPVRITDAGGSYITSDPAVGPDGTVYVAWWNYSADNEIGIDRCSPPSNCGSAASWGTDATVAALSTDVSPALQSHQVPFACPIMAQPGGRAAPVPSVAVDGNGRLYVAWSDLRAGSGTTRCDFNDTTFFGTPPSPTHQTFDSFVATAPNYTTLTNDSTTPSATRGSRIFNDNDSTPTATNSDDWFPWVAVDPSTNNAYVDVYSTTGDATRRTANFYLATVTPPASGTQPVIGTPKKLTEVPSDYSQSTDLAPGGCCQFQNDYGDYEGLAAAGGVVYPVWTFRTGFGDDGDIHMDVAVRRPRATTGAASDVGQTAASLNGTVNPGGAPGTYHFEYGPTASYGSRSPAADADAGSDVTDHAVSASIAGLAPGTTYHYRLVASSCGGCSGGTVAGADAVFTTQATTTTTTPPPPPPPVDRTAPRLKITLSTRVDRKRRYTVKLAAAGEPAKGSAVLRLTSKGKRKLASGLIATSGKRSLKLVLRLKRKDFNLLRRKHKLRVRLTVALSDVAGNKAHASKTFTLRLSRR